MREVLLLFPSKVRRRVGGVQQRASMRAARAATTGGIEDIIASRRGHEQLPSRQQLQTRTSSLMAQHNPSRENTPQFVTATEDELLARAKTISFVELQAACDEIMGENELGQGGDWGDDAEIEVLPGSDRGVSGGTSLLDGDFDEEESAASFAAALDAYRRGTPAKAETESLGDRLLKRRLVPGLRD